jgi:membrane-bound lytic murein transglycosylase MltF
MQLAHNTALRRLSAWMILLAAGLLAAAASAAASSLTGKQASWLKPLLEKTWTGDLNGMTERRVIRALVVYSKTYYFLDKGTQRGISYDFLKLFEDELNAQLRKRKKRPVIMVFIPVTRDQLIPALMAGRGDIAAAGITITPGRDRLVDFSNPTVRPVDEIIVTGPATPPISQLSELSGKEVFVRKSSSYYEHLATLDAQLRQQGKKPIRLELAPESLEDEDLLEMLDAGLVQLVVVDQPIAEFWSGILPNIKARTDLPISSGGEIAWMFRAQSPRLAAAVNAFLKRHGSTDAARAEILRKYLKSTKFVRSATSPAELRKFQATIDLFKKYGAMYNIDYLLMMAQGYQESRLDQNARSRAGAIGMMQVMPATGRQLRVGDIRKVEPNIHAGVKYIAHIRDERFGNESMDELNKDLFTFAAYNAGPARIDGLRKVAGQRGLNPNVWLGNVELIAADKIGSETPTYVGNIFKYYVAYALAMQRMQEGHEREGRSR